MSNLWRSLEMSLINCEVELSLSWIKNCVLSGWENIDNAGAVANAGAAATFKITDAKLYVPVVTLSAEDNPELAKQLSEGFKRPVYWNKYKVIDNKVVEITDANAEKYIREMLDSNYEGVKRLFVFAHDNMAGNNQVSVDSYQKYWLPRVIIRNYNIEFDVRNFYYQLLMTQLSNTKKSVKYQEGKVMIIQRVVYWILRILKKITD